MPGLTQRIADVRRRRPVLDHILLMQEHYGAVKAGQQAGAVTYFGFLSIFPILALAVFVVGVVAAAYPDAQETLEEAVQSVLPGMIGNDPSQISLDDIQRFSGWGAVIGLAGVLYSGLGWISALRDALVVVFEVPDREQPNFIIGKARDLLTLTVLGVVLLVAVALTGFVSGFAEDLLGWLGFGSNLTWLVTILSIAVGVGANVVLFYLMFRLLAQPHVPRGSLWAGAVLGAIGFEILKQLANLLLAATANQPAFQAFGVALILVVWINYFARLALYAAAWAYTTPAARAARFVSPPDPVQGPAMPPVGEDADDQPSGRAAFAAGAVAGATVASLLRRRPPV